MAPKKGEKTAERAMLTGDGKGEKGSPVEMETEEDDPLFPSGDDGCKILIEDDGKNRCGKGGIGEIIHRPAKDLSLLNWTWLC